MKLLVIDDSQDITDLFVKVLSTIGHEVIATDNGKDGLDIMNNQKFDTVFLDIAMPDFSGLDVIDSLLENGKINDSAIVLFTASSITDDEVNDLIKKGVHSCIRKPVRIETLLEKIDELSQIHSEVSTPPN
ncbi:MAG TPA: response regulator [Nitrososphaeraceae archaeon]|jgi:DNA-binding response OmpR family regulator|nr:response regulator [Nitrososphaeraceae archaeon]HZC47684.1 response regulator [Nitrososphaeraceae archaeon]